MPGTQLFFVGDPLFLVHIEDAIGAAAVAALVIARPDRGFWWWIVREGRAGHGGGGRRNSGHHTVRQGMVAGMVFAGKSRFPCTVALN